MYRKADSFTIYLFSCYYDTIIKKKKKIPPNNKANHNAFRKLKTCST